MKTENEHQKRLRQLIKSLKKIYKEGGRLIQAEVTYGIRDMHPCDKEYDERTASFLRQEKHDGSISIRLELFNPK